LSLAIIEVVGIVVYCPAGLGRERAALDIRRTGTKVGDGVRTIALLAVDVDAAARHPMQATGVGGGGSTTNDTATTTTIIIIITIAIAIAIRVGIVICTCGMCG
jgi:hypothetical protein